jgi:hypothetical protein
MDRGDSLAGVGSLNGISSPSDPPDHADAALLYTAERRDLARDNAPVGADDAVFERLSNAPDAADVAAVEICGPLPSLLRLRGRVEVGVSLAIFYAFGRVSAPSDPIYRRAATAQHCQKRRDGKDWL